MARRRDALDVHQEVLRQFGTSARRRGMRARKINPPSRLTATATR